MRWCPSSDPQTTYPALNRYTCDFFSFSAFYSTSTRPLCEKKSTRLFVKLNSTVQEPFAFGVTRRSGLVTQGGALFLVNSFKSGLRVERKRWLFENSKHFSEAIFFSPQKNQNFYVRNLNKYQSTFFFSKEVLLNEMNPLAAFINSPVIALPPDLPLHHPIPL